MPKILKFRIKHYKSIIDSGDCYLNENITILAGKNESGKTSILEALQDFDLNKDIDESVKPIQNPTDIPQISVTFSIEKATLKSIFDKTEIDIKPLSDVTIEVLKTFPNRYSITPESSAVLGIQKSNEIIDLIKQNGALEKIVKKIHTKHPSMGGTYPVLDYAKTEASKNNIVIFEAETSPSLEQIIEQNEKTEFSESLENLKNNFSRINEIRNLKTKFLEEFNNKWLPNFILFKSFEDVFPNKVPFSELESNEWIKDLALVSDLEVATVKSSIDRDKHRHKKAINITINTDYKKFWTQDVTSLSIDWDSENLLFWIEEDGQPYEPSLRSKGKQWHLAFYIRVSARSSEDVSNIILIDEPGLFLHAKALKDILQKLESASRDTPIIFSTHSPYLLESDKLSRVRLIHRTKDKGTKIENKIHALADKETLTPILTAIGLELSSGIINLDKKKNVVVEGPSDNFYLNAFKKIIGITDVNFIFGGGAGNMPFVGTILNGWGCVTLYLYDNDKGKSDGERNLKDNWLVSSEIILTVIEEEGSIEDIFTPADFKKYVLNDETLLYTIKNSEYLKTKKSDKVLLAKLFANSFSEVKPKLEEATQQNINKLFKLLSDKFKSVR